MFDQRRHGFERSAHREGFLERGEIGIDHARFFEADAPPALAGDEMGDGGGEGAANDFYRARGGLLRGLDGIARVGEERGRAGGGDDEQGVAAGEAAEIADVGRGGDEQRVDLERSETGGEGVETIVVHAEGTRTSLPEVRRDSRSRCACAASESG